MTENEQKGAEKAQKGRRKMEKAFNRIFAVVVPALVAIIVLVYFVPEQRTELRAVLHYFSPMVIAGLALMWAAGVAIAAIRKPLVKWWRGEIFVRGRHWDEYDPNPRNQDVMMAPREWH